MTDHLEPYRRMARSIRFFPPSALVAVKGQITEPVTSPVVDSWVPRTSSKADVKPLEPPIDLSAHAAALVHEAVKKPTVLPATYVIPENIGDRISRMAAASSLVPVNSQPHFEPTLNGNSVHETKDDRLVYDAHRQVYAWASTIDTASVGQEATVFEQSVAEAVAETETPGSHAVIEEAPVVEEVAETETPVAQAPVAEEVAETETPVTHAVVEEVEETETPVTHAVVAETTLKQVAEEQVQPPTLLEKVSSVIEAVSTAFMHPEVVRKEATEAATETESKDSEELLTTEAAVTVAEVEAAPSLMERVSAVVEVVTTTLKNPAAPEIAKASLPITVACPNCSSTELRKNGRRQGKQRYACKECGRQFAIAEVVINEEQPKVKDIATVEAATSQNSQVAPEVVETSTDTDAAKSSGKKKKAKGFGATKKSK